MAAKGRRYYNQHGVRYTPKDTYFRAWLNFRKLYYHYFGTAPHPWHDFYVFERDVGRPPEENCDTWALTWSPKTEPPTKENSHWKAKQFHPKQRLTINGETLTLQTWAARIGIHPNMLRRLFHRAPDALIPFIAALLQQRQQ